jgi:hypothetical protein
MRVVTEEIHTLEWQGLVIEVRYQPNWTGEGQDAIAHLDITCVRPERHPLPFTETGYRSHFLQPGVVEGQGGPVVYVAAWLAEASRTREWDDYIRANRQLSLF